MSALDYQVYQANVFKLARTLVVKYAPAADSINMGLFIQGLSTTPSPDDPTTWKYYLNIMGVRHPTDPQMRINIIDPTLFDQVQNPGENPFTPMDFTIANLAAHPATEKQYYIGSYFYNQLLSQYPTSEALIQGIVYPVTDRTIQQVIAAADGTILNYARELVEVNETDLIPRLQTWIQNFLATYAIADYAKLDDLYTASVLGVMFSHIPKVIMNIRLSNCHTERAHSYHVTEYLNSNGGIGQYVPYMTLGQRLALYRNIRYIFRNAGTQKTFQWLVDTVMTGQGIPLAGFDLRHNLGGMPNALRPQVELRRFPINFDQSGVESSTAQVREIVNEEAVFNFRNELDIDGVTADIIRRMQAGVSNSLPTKVLESSVYDTTDSVAYPLSEVLVNYWIYLSVNNQFNATVYVVNPLDGTPIVMSPLDAFILYLYCQTTANYILADGTRARLVVIPQVGVRNIIRPTPPSSSSLRYVVDQTLVSDAMIDQVLAGDVPVTGTIVDVDVFYTRMQTVQAQLMANRLLYATQEDFRTRGYMENIVNWLYLDATVDLAPSNTLYTDWLVTKGLDFTAFTPSDFQKLANDLLQGATGIGDSVSVSLAQIQTAMLGIMRTLCSYNVQFIQNISGLAEIQVDAPQPRMGYIVDEMMDLVESELLGQPIAPTSIMSDSVTSDLIGNQLETEGVFTQYDSYDGDMGIDLTLGDELLDHLDLSIVGMDVQITDFDGTGNPPIFQP